MVSKKNIEKKSVKKKVTKKKSAAKNTVDKKAVKKTVKKKAVKSELLSDAQKKKIEASIKRMEEQMLTHYESIVKLSGKDWGKEKLVYEKKVKAEAKKAQKKIEGEIKKNPAKAAVVAAGVTAVAGAFLLSMLKKK